ncbi:MAG: hypothetical protein IQL11_12810 [Bacteroidales bacterium]|nr:hypothetical protein [Bacteroidales bacterium]
MRVDIYKGVPVRLKRVAYILLIVIVASFSTVSSQETKRETPPLRERLFFGGSLGLQFGTITDIEISPIVGLWVLPRVAIAAGPNYRFYKSKLSNVWTDIYGGRFYTELVVIQDINSIIPVGIHTGIFLHIEDELLSLQSSFWKNPPYASNRFWVNTILAGAGISQQMGRRSALNIMVLWALNESLYSLYSNPEIRFSFTF